MSNLYAIGDIHGHISVLEELFVSVPFQQRDEIIFVGDYIDRGPNSSGVVDFLIDKKKEFPEMIFLRGNHEDMFIDFFEGTYRYQKDFFEEKVGVETLRSYGHIPGTSFSLSLEHQKFYKELLFFYETEDFLFAHAGFRPGIPISEQENSDMIWIREDFIGAKYDFGKPVVFGHSPMYEILDELPILLGIDTGLVFGGKLTCVKLQKRKIVEIFQIGQKNIE